MRGERPGALGNLLLGVALSSALHAAVLTTSFEGPPARGDGGPAKPGLSVQLQEQPKADTAAPAPTPRPAANPGAPSLGRYFGVREVDTPARARNTVPLVYPEGPLIWKLHGVVRLRLLINEHGTVDAAQVVHAEPAGEFEDAALAAVRQLRYDPALKNGRRVKSVKLIEVTFDPYETAAR